MALRRTKKKKVTREHWIAAARKRLISKGIDGVSVEGLAADFDVTRGGFYWHFKNRKDLLDCLLQDWEANSSNGLVEAIQSSSEPLEQIRALIQVWIEERKFSPAYDAAVRDWARTSRAADAVVRRVDAFRIDLIDRIFRGLGYDEDESLIRARVTYYHQVGYYSLRVRQTREDRYAAAPTYLKILAGMSIPPDFFNSAAG